MSADEWTRLVLDAAQEVSEGAGEVSCAGSLRDRIGRLVVLMGRAAGHADQRAGSGPTAEKARDHFRAEMREVGRVALGLLQESRDRRGCRSLTNDEVSEDVARRLVLGARVGARGGSEVQAGHASAALGAGIAAIGRALQTIPLDDEQFPRLNVTLESVLGHAIAAVARSQPRSWPTRRSAR